MDLVMRIHFFLKFPIGASIVERQLMRVPSESYAMEAGTTVACRFSRQGAHFKSPLKPLPENHFTDTNDAMKDRTMNPVSITAKVKPMSAAVYHSHISTCAYRGA